MISSGCHLIKKKTIDLVFPSEMKEPKFQDFSQKGILKLTIKFVEYEIQIVHHNKLLLSGIIKMIFALFCEHGGRYIHVYILVIAKLSNNTR